MELVTNEWQDIALTWKKEEGLMLYVNGAFRDSLKDGTVTSLIPNKQARLTIGRKSGNPPFKYTRYEATTVLWKLLIGVIKEELQVFLPRNQII